MVNQIPCEEPIMSEEEIALLNKMCRRYGTYLVLKEITEQGRKECDETYANNQGAVIHRDIAIMEDAIELMMAQSPIRGIR